MTRLPRRAPLRLLSREDGDVTSAGDSAELEDTASALRSGATPAVRDRAELDARAEAELQWGTSADIPLDALYARYAPYVAAIAMRILGRESEVEDLVQDVFAISVRGLRRRKNHAEIKRWLATVTVRRSMRRLRMLALWSWMDLDDETHWDEIADAGAGPDERRLVASVYRALDRVPIRDRVAWVLRNVEGESLQQVAALCGCSLATAKRRIARAHTKISVAVSSSAAPRGDAETNDRSSRRGS